jgi:NADH:ubiquinone oxidoreductase subunit K
MIVPEPRKPVPLTRRQAVLVWLMTAALLVAAPVVAVVAAASVSAPPGARGLAAVFLLVAAPMTAVDLALAYVTARMRRSAPPGANSEALAATQTIVASALVFGAATMSCIFFFVSREPLLLLLVLPCAAVLLHWRPTEARWARLAPAAPGSPAARRMIRE